MKSQFANDIKLVKEWEREWGELLEMALVGEILKQESCKNEKKKSSTMMATTMIATVTTGCMWMRQLSHFNNGIEVAMLWEVFCR